MVLTQTQEKADQSGRINDKSNVVDLSKLIQAGLSRLKLGGHGWEIAEDKQDKGNGNYDGI